ncbi:hypothetical protein [Acholeplasma brassicae]
MNSTIRNNIHITSNVTIGMGVRHYKIN